jgi:signal transduction histidine kinase
MQGQFRDNRVTVYSNLANDLPRIFGDRIQLQQVVLNLLINAIDAMNALPNHNREIRVNSSKCNIRGVAVTIEDTGVGIDPGSITHVFDAFHSTKRDGMGIGLSICRSTIEAHGGHIWAIPTKRRGATFCFTLPGDREKTL